LIFRGALFSLEHLSAGHDENGTPIARSLSAIGRRECMSTVFISYRREITAGEARALCNDLLERLGKNSVFMDVDSSVS
jgi:hypothetical protein